MSDRGIELLDDVCEFEEVRVMIAITFQARVAGRARVRVRVRVRVTVIMRSHAGLIIRR